MASKIRQHRTIPAVKYTDIKTVDKLDIQYELEEVNFPENIIHTCFWDIYVFKALCGPKLICFCSLLPNLTVSNLPCLHLHLYLPGTIKMLKETSSDTAAEAVKHFPKDRLRILSMLKVIFITQTRPEINTSSGLFGPCLHRAVSVQTFNHIHFYKPVCLINSLGRHRT